MPELPEVETVVRELRDGLQGRRIERMEALWSKTFQNINGRDVDGQRVRAIGRKGKYILLYLDDQDMIIHLRMSGQLLFTGARSQAPHKHDRLIFDLEGGERLVFRDARKFGRVYLVNEADSHLAHVGMDALDPRMTPSHFRNLLRQSRQGIKAFLLSQKGISGLGNIYVDEALFLAGIHPLTRCVSIKNPHELRTVILGVLTKAIDNMGSTISDYRNTRGNEGMNQHYFYVYGRQGLPCKKCGAIIVKARMAGRGTHFCPECQPEA